MDGANNGAATTCQEFQQINALETGGTVQSGCWFIEEHDRRIVDQFQGNR